MYIMRITVPPEKSWVAEFCNEMATLVFFCVTGWKFRPGCNNPYFKIDEEDMVEINTKNALTENVSNRKKNKEEGSDLDKTLTPGREDKETRGGNAAG